MAPETGDMSDPPSISPGSSDASFGGQVETSDPTRLATAPLVSVLMITYNHAEYLAEAIQGIVDQQCDFPFELVIGEDKSSDESLEVALGFQARYPHIVRVLHSPANVGMNANSRRVRAAARGKYVAWCEGDDYWCSTTKLASQAALMEADPGMGAVHSDWVRSTRQGGAWVVDWHRPVHSRVPDALLQGCLLPVFHYPKILRTCTLMFRKCIADECDASEFGRKDYAFGDAVTSLFITSKWRVGYLPQVMAVYRESPRSVLRSGIGARIAFLKSSLQFDTDARRVFAGAEDYPDSYRLEVAVGLLLWSMKAGDRASFKFALEDLRANFGLRSMLAAARRGLWMRRPLLRRRPRALAAVQPGGRVGGGEQP
ncbi:MAG: glycosyltransferase [Acetobacteraceae bacterium]|nr:MAG: glycosyltransferase [Acetobacteraceae bacterium]